jgi:hypothetical protein
MRVTIKAVKVPAGGWSVTAVNHATGKSILENPRLLGEIPDAEGRLFPAPPTGDPEALPGDVPEAEIGTYFANVMGQKGDPDGVARLGRYLFRTLLGSALWERILAAAPAEEPIELALTWDADSPLHRLPWEVMHTGTTSGSVREGFLAHQPGMLFTRRVAETTGERFKIEKLPSPPRVLVIVGSALTDTRIRPGAEYLGLLRALKDENQSLNTRLIVEATASQVSRAISQFAPNVVHIIGHGTAGPGVLLRGEETKDDLVDAARLVQILTIDDKVPLPKLVVLNACSPNVLDEVTLGRPMAAQLVRAGIPVVIGMSGNVADQACRVFTRKFYTALLDGTEIATAAAQGRRAGVANGGYDAPSQIDWGLPALFMAEEIGPVKIDTSAPDPDRERLAAARTFTNRPDYPTFCGRWDFFGAYRELMSTSTSQILMVPVQRQDDAEDQFGSERLLRELAAEAVRDGHIPILVSKDFLRARHHKWPSDLDEFLRDYFVKAVNQTVQLLSGIQQLAALRQEPRLTSLALLRPGVLATAPGGTLSSEFDNLNDDQRLAKALMLDLVALRSSVCRLMGIKEADIEKADPKVLLLIEDFHDLLFGEKLLELFEDFGLRDARARDVTRAVITYHLSPVEPQATTIKALIDFEGSLDVTRKQLMGLHAPIVSAADAEAIQEASLIYRQFLLKWRDRETPRPLSISAQAAQDAEFLQTLAAATSDGIPSKLDREGLWGMVYVLAKRGTELREANDDDIITAESQLPVVREA